MTARWTAERRQKKKEKKKKKKVLSPVSGSPSWSHRIIQCAAADQKRTEYFIRPLPSWSTTSLHSFSHSILFIYWLIRLSINSINIHFDTVQLFAIIIIIFSGGCRHLDRCYCIHQIFLQLWMPFAHVYCSSKVLVINRSLLCSSKCTNINGVPSIATCSSPLVVDVGLRSSHIWTRQSQRDSISFLYYILFLFILFNSIGLNQSSSSCVSYKCTFTFTASQPQVPGRSQFVDQMCVCICAKNA